MITGTTTYEHKLTPLELEMELWGMNAEEQVCFLHNLATRWLHRRMDVEIQMKNIFYEMDCRTYNEMTLIHDFLLSFEEARFEHLNGRTKDGDADVE